MSTNASFGINIKRLVRHMGGPAVLARHATHNGYRLSEAAVSQWLARERIPMQAWLGLCAAHYQRTGEVLDLREYLTGKPRRR